MAVGGTVRALLQGAVTGGTSSTGVDWHPARNFPDPPATLPLGFTVFFMMFGILYAASPAFASVVGQAFGGLNEAVVAMVAWCRSL